MIVVGFDAPLKIWLKLSIWRSAGHQPIAAFIVGHPFKQSRFGSFFEAQQQDRPRNLVTFTENGRKAAFLASATDQGACKHSAGEPRSEERRVGKEGVSTGRSRWTA